MGTTDPCESHSGMVTKYQGNSERINLLKTQYKASMQSIVVLCHLFLYSIDDGSKLIM